MKHFVQHKYSEDQPRDEDGQWTDGGGSSSSGGDDEGGDDEGGDEEDSGVDFEKLGDIQKAKQLYKESKVDPSKKDDIAALGKYRGDADEIIGHLRGTLGKDPSPEALKAIEGVEKTIDNYKTKRDITLYRGVHEEFSNQILAMRKGESWVDNSFTSASLSKDAAKKFGLTERGTTIIKLTVPKGLAAYAMNGRGANLHSHEHEVLLQRGYRYRITAKKQARGYDARGRSGMISTVHVTVEAVEGKSFSFKYSDDQPRDEDGRWTDGGGSSDGPTEELGSSDVMTPEQVAELSRLVAEDRAKEKDFFAMTKDLYDKGKIDPSLPDADEALSEYNSDEGYLRLNSKMREGKPMSNSDMSTVRDIEATIDNFAMPKNVTVYRGVNGDFADRLASKEVGDSWHDNSFASTSLDRGVAMDFADNQGIGRPVMMEIKVPKGFNAFPFRGGEEHELLLPRRTKFTITGKRRVKGITTFKVSVWRNTDD